MARIPRKRDAEVKPLLQFFFFCFSCLGRAKKKRKEGALDTNHFVHLFFGPVLLFLLGKVVHEDVVGKTYKRTNIYLKQRKKMNFF